MCVEIKSIIGFGLPYMKWQLYDRYNCDFMHFVRYLFPGRVCCACVSPSIRRAGSKSFNFWNVDFFPFKICSLLRDNFNSTREKENKNKNGKINPTKNGRDIRHSNDLFIFLFLSLNLKVHCVSHCEPLNQCHRLQLTLFLNSVQ